MEPCVVAVSAHHNAPTSSNLILGHGGVAHGLERQRGGDERSNPAAPGAASQSAARIFCTGQRFP